MPIYEYHCHKCGKDFDIIQKISEPLKKKCEECGGKLEKLLSNPSFQLKGTGWYKTDYAAKPAAAKTDKEPTKAPKAEATETKKVETKTASKE